MEQIVTVIGLYVAIAIEFLKKLFNCNATILRILSVVIGGVLGVGYYFLKNPPYSLEVMILLGIIAGFTVTGGYAIASGLLKKVGQGER